MSKTALTAGTINTVAGFYFGSTLAQRGFYGLGCAIVILGFLAGTVIIGTALRRD